MKQNKKNFINALVMLLLFALVVVPIQVSGKVKQITEVEDKLEGISEEEKKVLEELFTINQKMEELETEKKKINSEINTLQKQIKDIEEELLMKQKDYDLQLDILKKVLVNYQRQGPATYLEILLKADNFSTFLKSINTIKDISHNVNELLTSLEDGKKALQEEKIKLDEKAEQLDRKNTELSDNIHKNELLQKEKQTYLESLQENKAYYSKQLENLQTMWEDCQKLFPKIAKKLTDTINAGYFTMDDLNLKFDFLNITGFLNQDTFNSIIQENPDLAKTKFIITKDQVTLEVPEEHLILTGDFIISNESAISFEVKEGSFYGMPLEKTSIQELFVNGPLMIDFSLVSKGVITVDIVLTKVECQEGGIAFEVTPKW